MVDEKKRCGQRVTFRAIDYLQYFDTVGCVTKRHRAGKKLKTTPLIHQNKTGNPGSTGKRLLKQH